MKTLKIIAKQRALVNFVSKRTLYTSQFLFNKDEEKIEDKKETPADLEKCLAQVKELQSQLAEKDIAMKDFKDKYMLSLADQENTRRIARVDVDNAKKYALQSFVLQLLEVADTLGLCLKTIPKEKQEELTSFVTGIKMTETVLGKILAKNGVTQVEDPVGKEFDPKVHEAMMKIPSKELKSGIVSNLLKTGYIYNERVIRAAQVVVVENGDD